MQALGFELLRGTHWPLVLSALALLGAGAWGLALRRREREALVARARATRFLPGFSPNRARARLVLAVLGIFLLAVSVLGPVRGFTQREVRQRGIDLVLCLDTSRSMLARDVKPSRLDRAKREVRGLLERLTGDRVALIGFSGDARQIAPLTHDRSTLSALLDDVSPADNRKGGTDLGVAIERALELFDGRTGNHEAIVLLTDGEDLEGKGAKAAEAAAARNIRVYVVGVGTPQGGKIPALLADGSEGFLQDRAGREVVTKLEPSTLDVLARSTGGSYLSMAESPTPLEDLYRVGISRLDRRDVAGGVERVPHDRFQWTLVLALACILGEAGLRERRPRMRHREEISP